jgi:hypothetical protein
MTGRHVWVTLGTLVTALAVAVAALWVFDIWPFSPSVDDLVSRSVGTRAKCRTLGLAEIAGERSKVYSCAARMNGGDVVLCRAVIDGDVYVVSDDEFRGCGGI